MGIVPARADCPRRGCNISRQACGGHRKVFDQIGTVHEGLLLQHVTRLDGSSRNEVMSNLGIGKSAIFTELIIWFDCMEHIPVKCCASGHGDLLKARAYEALLLTEYENVPYELQQHKVSFSVCNPASPPFGEAIQFIQGCNLATIPRMMVFQNKAKSA